MNWDAESIRVTLFFSPRGLEAFAPLLASIVGKEPEEVVERPKSMRHEMAKSSDSRYFFLTQQANRIDFLLGVPPNLVLTEQNPFVSVGPYNEARKIIYDPAVALLKRPGFKISRIAVAPIVRGRPRCALR